MARSFPITDRPLAKTTTDFGRFQRAEGLRGMNTDLSASIQSASQAPQINARSFVVADQSRGALGQVVQQEAGAVTQMLLKQAEGINIIKENEAAMAMDMERKAIFADLQKEPDETKWAEIAERRTKALGESILKEPLSPAARERIEVHLNMWKSTTGGDAVRMSADRTFKKVGEKGIATAMYQVDSGDFGGAVKTVSSLHDAGYIGAEDKARMDIDIQGKAKRNLVRDTLSVALDNPEAILSDPEGALSHIEDPGDRDTIIRKARQVKQQRESDVSDQLSDRLASGEFTTLADLKAAIPEGMSPTIQKQFEGMFLRAQQPGIKAKLEADAPQNFARFSDVVDKYDAKDDPDGVRYAQIVMTVKQAMPEELRGEILGPLYKKRPGADSAIEPPEPLKATVKDVVGVMFEDGALGKFRSQVPGKTYGTFDTVEDPKAKAAAYAKKGNVMIYMNKWMAANPDATPDQALEAIRKFLSGSAPSIRSTLPRATPPAIKKTSAAILPTIGWEDPDLPTGGEGGPSSDLIPFFPPAQ